MFLFCVSILFLQSVLFLLPLYYIFVGIQCQPEATEWQLLGTRQGTGRAEVFEVPAGGDSGGFFRMLNR